MRLNPCPENFDQNVVVYPKLPSWGSGVGCKLPNNLVVYPNYQGGSLHLLGGGGGKLPNALVETTNDPEWPILPDLQLCQSFPTKVAQNDSEQPILPKSQLFPSFPTKVAQNDSEWPNLPNSQLFHSFPTEVAQNNLEWPNLPILPNLQLFQSFPTEVVQNDSE